MDQTPTWTKCCIYSLCCCCPSHTATRPNCKLYRSQGTVLDSVSQRFRHFDVAMLSWGKQIKNTTSDFLSHSSTERNMWWWRISVGRLYEIKHFDPEFIKYPLNKSLFGLKGSTPQVSGLQEHSWMARKQKIKSCSSQKPAKWTDESLSGPNLSFYPSLCHLLHLAFCRSRQQRCSSTKQVLQSRHQHDVLFRINLVSLITEWPEVSAQSL